MVLSKFLNYVGRGKDFCEKKWIVYGLKWRLNLVNCINNVVKWLMLVAF